MSWRLGHYLELLCCPYCHAQLEYREPYLYCHFHKRRFLVNGYKIDFQFEASERFEKPQKQLTS